MHDDKNHKDKKALRTHMRQKRGGLSTMQQRKASEHLAQKLGQQLFFLRAQHIAFYLANDGEIDPAIAMARSQAVGKKTYLPTLHPVSLDAMAFMAWQHGDKLKPNRFGIDEPRWTKPIKPWLLDIVFLPLVAFDKKGNRLGMGGGFYDRTFEDRKEKPLLIGLAHHFQECEELISEPWDIPLDGIATDLGVRLFRPNYTHRQQDGRN